VGGRGETGAPEPPRTDLGFCPRVLILPPGLGQKKNLYFFLQNETCTHEAYCTHTVVFVLCVCVCEYLNASQMILRYRLQNIYGSVLCIAAHAKVSVVCRHRNAVPQT